jgi:hypothetical protein
MKAAVNRFLQPKLLILGAVLASLAGLATGLLMNREPSPSVAATAFIGQLTARPPRPARTAAEEQYLRDLWPIHGDVQRSTLRMSLGQIFYITQDLSRDELGVRVRDALAVYQAAETRLRSLEAPVSLRSEHEEYLTAVRLFQESATELLKMFADGRDEHMGAAYPKGQEGSDKIREVGGKFWPHEFPPH